MWFDRRSVGEQKARASLNLKLKWRPPLFPLEVADCIARLHALLCEGRREREGGRIHADLVSSRH